MVFDGEQVLGGTVLFLTPQVLHTQYISATAEGKACGAIDLLFDELLHKVFATYRYIDFGKSTSNDSADLNAQLIFQKEGFGARLFAMTLMNGRYDKVSRSEENQRSARCRTA